MSEGDGLIIEDIKESVIPLDRLEWFSHSYERSSCGSDELNSFF
jgi:hypothetical protein